MVIVRRSTTARTYSNSQVVLPPPRDVDDALVSVQSYAPRMVFVGGEVRTPGFVPYHTSLTALQSIIGAGGSLHTATLDRVIVLRKTGVPVPVAIAVDLATDTEGTSWNDFPLRPYDIVIVPMSGVAKLDLLVDQYLYQLVPAAKNINFTFFYNLKSGSVTVTP